jgi:hypothetical protein
MELEVTVDEEHRDSYLLLHRLGYLEERKFYLDVQQRLVLFFELDLAQLPSSCLSGDNAIVGLLNFLVALHKE